MYKKLFSISFAFLLGICNSPVSAESFSEEELPIVVKCMQEWSSDYPTVINNWNGMFVNEIDGEIPPLLSVITMINGRSTKGMNTEEFNSILKADSRTELEYLRKNEGRIVKRNCTIKYPQNIYWAEGVNLEYPTDFPDNISIKANKGIAFFNINTYDYQISSTTGIDEKAILEVAARALNAKGLIKESEGHPDIILSLSTGKDQWNGTSVILNVLDGRKLEQGIEQSIWTLEISDLKNNLKESESRIKTEINKYCVNYPFETPTFCNKIQTLGIGFSSKEAVGTGKVLKVLKGSDAFDKGLRDGDLIESGYYGGGAFESSLIWYSSRKYWFKANRRLNQKNWGVDWLLCLPIIPHYKKNESEHYLTMYYPNDAWRRSHFQVKKINGNRVKMDAPFDSHTFSFTYMR